MVVCAIAIRQCNLAFRRIPIEIRKEWGNQLLQLVLDQSKSGKSGITSFFNWYYFTFTFAMMVSLTAIVYVQSDVSWAWGLVIPTFMMFFSCVMFIGTRNYVKVKPRGGSSHGCSCSKVEIGATK